MRRGLILINAYSRLNSSLNQSTRLKEELEMLGVSMDIKTNDEYICSIKDSEIVSDAHYDFCIYLDKDKYMSEMLESTGMRLFNSHRAILDCDDKMCTYIKLAGHDLNLVDTMAGLLCYTPSEDIKMESVERIEDRFGYPVIVKECYGSLGQGVYKCDNREELLDIMRKVKMIPHLFERFVSSSMGRDIRVIVIGGKCVAAMIRHSDGDFRSNLELGGHGEKIDITPDIEEQALGATRVLGLDYAGVDLLFGENGELLVCEVNSNAFFGGIEKVTGINVAKVYAEYIVDEIYNKSDISILKDNMNRISITNLAVERCSKNLGRTMNDMEIIELLRTIMLDDEVDIYRSGKNWYVELGKMSFTINSSSYMIITAHLVK